MKVASLQKHGDNNLVKPSWVLDCVKQNEKDAGLPDYLLPFEPRYFQSKYRLNSQALIKSFRHMFFTMEGREDDIKANVDQFSDSYARDTNVDELKEVPFYPRLPESKNILTAHLDLE